MLRNCFLLLSLFFLPYDNYTEFKNFCKDYYSLSISIPKNRINFSYEDLVFEFGDEDDSHTTPIFEGEAVVQFSEQHIIVLENFKSYYVSTNDPDMIRLYKENGRDTISEFEGILRNNCGIAWQELCHHGENIQIKDSKWILSYYTNVLNDSDLLNQFKADKIMVFEFPNYSQITCYNDAFNKNMEKFNYCYGIELRRHGLNPIMLLCFMKQKRDLKDYLYSLTQYMHFE